MSVGQILHTLVTNPVFAGIAGGAGMSAVLFQLRRLPAAAFDWIKRRLTVTLVIDNDDALFDRLCIYLSTSPYVAKARWLRMVELYDDAEQRWCWRASFGLGWHLFRDGGSLFLMHRAGERDSKALIPKRIETITLHSLGAEQRHIRDLMKRAERVFEDISTVRVYLWHQGAYLCADRRPARSTDTLFLPDGQCERLLADLARFLNRREEYRMRGTPYRRGYLFEGPPGTGKTTLAFVLASAAQRPIYVINPNTAGGDTGLQAAFNAADPGAIIVIEDIDAMKESHDREVKSDVPAAIRPEQAVTLGGMLNAIDGLASRENRILVMTTNHVEKLDPALLRPGRIDIREHIGLMDVASARRMTLSWGADLDWFDQAVAPRCPISPAQMQELLLVKLGLADAAPLMSVESIAA